MATLKLLHRNLLAGSFHFALENVAEVPAAIHHGNQERGIGVQAWKRVGNEQL